jgi:hypothetical protein
MKQHDTLSIRNSAGLVWASLGLAITTLTFVGVGWIQLVSPVPAEGVFFLLALGGFPAALAMVLGLWRGFRAKRELLVSASDPVHSSGIRIACIGLGLLSLGVALFAGDCLRRQSQKRQWVLESQAAVEDLLHTADRIPAGMRERLGPFKGLIGKRFGGAAWNIQGYEFLIADRDAHFANATIPVRIYVTEGRKTNPESHGIVIKTVERDQSSLYLNDAPLPKYPTEGLRIMVSHPDLKKL